jgi:hypothetical protein
MNFTELYQRIRSIDEGTAPEPTAPGGVIKTKNADGTISYKPKVPGERLTGTIPAQGAKVTDKTDNTKAVNEARSDYTAQEMTDMLSGKRSQQQVDADAEKTRGPDKKVKEQQIAEECGDMMPMGMMGMSGPQGQQDNIDMNITLHGSGSGGVRDLMNILRNIESSDNKDVHSHDVSKIFGGEIPMGFDEEMSDGGFGDASTTPDPTVSGLDAVTDLGAPINGGDHRKRQAGLPQGAPMHETLVGRLSALYNEIKEAKEKEFDALKHIDKDKQTPAIKKAAKGVKRDEYGARTALMKAGGVKDDRGPAGVTQG